MSTDLNQITEKIIGCAYKVGNGLGCGFLEKVYENALVHELRKAGLLVEPQKSIDVIYDGVVVGQYFADLVVEGRIIVETQGAEVLGRDSRRAMHQLPGRDEDADLPTHQLLDQG